MIDLDTNGEITGGNFENYYVVSTACEPPLEGAGLTMGMRGTVGATEKVECEKGKIKVFVIGNKAPKGLCGSDVIDAVAVFIREGLIVKRGNFSKEKPLKPSLYTHGLE